MNGRDLSFILAVLVVVSGFSFVVTVLPEGVSASTLYVGGAGPGNFTAIQDAINISNPGDTIFVYSGLYPENISVFKPLSIIGEDRNTTEVGDKYGWGAVNVNADWVNLSGFTISNGWRLGLMLDHAHNCSIFNNIITLSNMGINIYIVSSSGIVMRNNTIIGSGTHIVGDLLENWNTHDIDTSNTINGRPVHYWKNVIGGKIPPDASQVILANVSGVTVENQVMSNVTSAILIGFSSHNIITNNTVHSNFENGIGLYYSDNNVITNNTAYNTSIPCSSSGNGIRLSGSHNNTIIGNRAWANGVSINVGGSNYNVITGNRASGSYGGIWVGGIGNLVSSNKAFYGMTGIRVFGEDHVIEGNNLTSSSWISIGSTISVWDAHNVIVANNTAADSGTGISVEDSYQIIVKNNTITDNVGGISLRMSTNNVIVGNTVTSNKFNGIFVWRSDSNTFSDNDILRNAVGFETNRSNGNVVSNSTIELNSKGFFIDRSNNNTIANNSISYNEEIGMHLVHSDYNTITNNDFSQNQGVGMHMVSSKHNTIVGNSVSWNKGTGMRLKHSDYNLITKNSVFHNTFEGIHLRHSNNNSIVDSLISRSMAGIDLWYSDNNTILNNTVSENEYGIHLWHSNSSTILNNRIISNTGSGVTFYNSNGNLAYRNKFIDNVIQARDNGGINQWDNGYPSGGNYWSDYSGDDALSGPNQNEPGGDGLGDTPYVVMANGADMFPLISTSGPVFPRPPETLGAFLSGEHSEYVTITWATSPDDGRGLRSVVGYEIYRNMDYNALGLGYELIASYPNGTSGFVDYLAGEGDPNDYFYRVCAVDIFGNITCAKEQVAKVSYSLSEGLNLVSIPLIQMDGNTETVLQTLSFDKVWTYDSLNQGWKSHMKSKPYGGDLVELGHSTGVWVNVTDESNLTVAGIVPFETVIQLRTGWNLVSFPSFNITYTTADLKAQTGATRVEGFDASALPYSLKVLQDTDFLQTGHGYWIQVPQDTMWTPPSA